MPVNANTDYYLAEREYHKASSPAEKLKALQKMLSIVPKHKGSEKLQEQLKKRIAKTKELAEKSRKAGKGVSTLKKEGAAQIIFVGFPNSGKSYILEKLSGVEVEQASYPFTTRESIVRTIKLEGVRLQSIEVPAIYPGFYEHEKGPEMFGLIRNADFVVLVLDGRSDIDSTAAALLGEFGKAGIELTKARKEKDGAQTFIPSIILLNREPDFRGELHNLELINFKDSKIDEIKNKIWSKLGLIRVYTKSGGIVAKKPIIMKKDSNVKDAAERVHKDFVAKFKYAKIWGDSAKFIGQNVGLDHQLKDKDVIELYST